MEHPCRKQCGKNSELEETGGCEVDGPNVGGRGRGLKRVWARIPPRAAVEGETSGGFGLYLESPEKIKMSLGEKASVEEMNCTGRVL